MKDVKTFLPEDPTGIRSWRNRENGFAIIELHYTADAMKRDPKWAAEAMKGMPQSEWEREYELSWDTHAGKPVYGKDFRSPSHVYLSDQEPEVGLPLLRGWDFGMTPACIIGQFVGRRLMIIDEVIGNNIGAVRFVPEVIDYCNLHYGEFEYYDFVDPAGFSAGKESEETTCVDVMRRRPNCLAPVAGDVTYEKRLGAVIELLTRLDGGRPCLMLNPRCKILIAGFRGGYQYPEKISPRSVQRMDRPLKNAFSHPHDALQYLATRVKTIRALAGYGRSKPISRHNYTFSGNRVKETKH